MVSEVRQTPAGAKDFQAPNPGIRKIGSVRVAGVDTGIRLSDIGRPSVPLEIPRPEVRRLTQNPIGPESFHQTPQIPIFESPETEGT